MLSRASSSSLLPSHACRVINWISVHTHAHTRSPCLLRPPPPPPPPLAARHPCSRCSTKYLSVSVSVCLADVQTTAAAAAAAVKAAAGAGLTLSVSVSRRFLLLHILLLVLSSSISDRCLSLPALPFSVPVFSLEILAEQTGMLSVLSCATENRE